MPSTDFIVGLAFCFPLVWALFFLTDKKDPTIHDAIWIVSKILVCVMLGSFGWGSYMILSEVFNGQVR